MGELVITGGNVVTPQGILANGAITVKDGIIQSIDASAGAAQVPGTDDRVIDAQDLYVLPGLISL
ncbi:MAG: alpha-D-ribose 1-methylphosphonate 5-triphosphate diphosphatase, partial [Candidatus Binatia bacterium]